MGWINIDPAQGPTGGGSLPPGNGIAFLVLTDAESVSDLSGTSFSGDAVIVSDPNNSNLYIVSPSGSPLPAAQVTALQFNTNSGGVLNCAGMVNCTSYTNEGNSSFSITGTTSLVALTSFTQTASGSGLTSLDLSASSLVQTLDLDQQSGLTTLKLAGSAWNSLTATNCNSLTTLVLPSSLANCQTVDFLNHGLPQDSVDAILNLINASDGNSLVINVASVGGTTPPTIASAANVRAAVAAGAVLGNQIISDDGAVNIASTTINSTTSVTVVFSGNIDNVLDFAAGDFVTSGGAATGLSQTAANAITFTGLVGSVHGVTTYTLLGSGPNKNLYVAPDQSGTL